jgi:anti-anti-sigma regulatory factor
MGEAELLAASCDGVTVIRVSGRGTFKISVEFRQFGEKVLDAGATSLILDLGSCAGLDSTFMGVMAMLGLRGRGRTAFVIVNASASLRALLDGIGVSALWRFSDTPAPDSGWTTVCRAAAGALTVLGAADTVLDAHQTLMRIDPENVPRFQSLVTMLADELGRRP